ITRLCGERLLAASGRRNGRRRRAGEDAGVAPAVPADVFEAIDDVERVVADDPDLHLEGVGSGSKRVTADIVPGQIRIVGDNALEVVYRFENISRNGWGN